MLMSNTSQNEKDTETEAPLNTPALHSFQNDRKQDLQDAKVQGQLLLSWAKQEMDFP